MKLCIEVWNISEKKLVLLLLYTFDTLKQNFIITSSQTGELYVHNEENTNEEN